MKIFTLQFEVAVRVRPTKKNPNPKAAIRYLFRRIAALGLGVVFRATHLIPFLWFGLGLG